jgi:hypothetical protein
MTVLLYKIQKVHSIYNERGLIHYMITILQQMIVFPRASCRHLGGRGGENLNRSLRSVDTRGDKEVSHDAAQVARVQCRS